MNDLQIAGAGGCFRAGTQVQLEHGKTISIELIKEGDEVLAFDEDGNLHASKVTKVHYHPEPQPILRVKFWKGFVEITPNH
jgi:3-dehydroquinate synthase class II